MIYDMNNIKSLENVSKWMELYNEHKEYSAFAVVVGNKMDIQNWYNIWYCSKYTKEIIDEKLKELKDVERF